MSFDKTLYPVHSTCPTQEDRKKPGIAEKLLTETLHIYTNKKIFSLHGFTERSCTAHILNKINYYI